MAQLLTVGEFSRLTHLTVKALHHYHESGVLEPAAVDPFTGYRYYGPDQLPAAHLVRRLREVRMPLAEVRALLAAPRRGDEGRRDRGPPRPAAPRADGDRCRGGIPAGATHPSAS